MNNNIRLTNAGNSPFPGDHTSSSLTVQSKGHLKKNKKGLYISKIIIIIIFFLVILIITLATILAVGKQKSSAEHTPCLDDWIGYLGKCFYFSENTTTWTASQNFCVSHAATLAVFNTTKELNFLKRYSDHSQYWIGLSLKPGQTWMWIDGTLYKAWFKIIGIGECAYLHKSGISSASTHLVRKWICSKPYTCIPRS
ncbi:C-type lectin domain family 2 member A-like isoform X1 [Pteropus medius]|uniref:C-type lectin domain family 2 member A-like isoform X1 n=1 Tax=Pteropus vampyrus TaxID=132908 RepID=UPI00196A3EAE|nr:C-type lectin domain family 2 member A-like isoform X1 [Pteropus giganteus]XP_039730218.1 C-type lectin domain family 2 member A-like isoform X1 [Pteropus giganteus]